MTAFFAIEDQACARRERPQSAILIFPFEAEMVAFWIWVNINKIQRSESLASVSELVSHTAEVFGEQTDTVRSYARAMIDGGVLPKSRGRAISQVELRHIIALVTAVAIEPRIKNTAKEVERYLSMTLEYEDKGDCVTPFTSGDYLLNTFQPLFSWKHSGESRNARNNVRRLQIEFVRNWYEIGVTMVSEDRRHRPILRFRDEGTPGQWAGYIKRSTTVSGIAIQLVGMRCGLLEG